MKKKISLLYGGKSAEHKVSLQTAKAVIAALDYNKFEVFPVFITPEGQWIKGNQITGPVTSVQELEFSTGEHEVQLQQAVASNKLDETEYDVVFPLLHGPNGEDGTVQGMLELLNVAYVGNGVLASSAGMDKVVMKNIFAQAGLPQVKYTWFIRSEWKVNEVDTYTKVEQEIGYPCFIKPANLGSSVGISKANNREELVAAFTEAFLYDRKIIIEEGVTAREIELAVLGNDFPDVSVAGEIVPKTDFYDYQAKYEDGNTALVIPAEISTELNEKLRGMAVTAFKSLDCSGLVRADFFVTKDEQIYINEVNTMPGFTPFSMFPLLWKHTGVEYDQLIEKLVALAIERHEEKQQIKFN